MLHHAEALRAAGYEVSVICPKGELPEERESFEVIQGMSVYRYPAVWRARGKLAYLFEYLWALLCSFALSWLVWAREGFDAIHAANPPDIFFLVAWPFKLMGKKFVYDEHDLCPELYTSKFGKAGAVQKALLFMQERSYHAADLVISTNQSYRDVARERGGIGDERSAIVRNGVDITEFHRGPARPELKSGFQYLAAYVGIMGVQDGVDRIVHAAHHLVHDLHRRDVLFVLIGKGECWQPLQRLAAELEVSDYFNFTGRISDELLLDYFSTADVCLAPDPPDRMNQLSTMTKIMEYMACGNPIVSFDLLETRRSAGEAAVYVNRDDPKLFGDELVALLDDPARRKAMAKVGLDRTLQVVGLGRSKKALIDAYDRMFGVTRFPGRRVMRAGHADEAQAEEVMSGGAEPNN